MYLHFVRHGLKLLKIDGTWDMDFEVKAGYQKQMMDNVGKRVVVAKGNRMSELGVHVHEVVADSRHNVLILSSSRLRNVPQCLCESFHRN
jgi:hypothetical protein